MQILSKFCRSSLVLLAIGGLSIGSLQAAEKANNASSTAEQAKSASIAADTAKNTSTATEMAKNTATDAEKAKVAQFCWTELATSNVQAAKDFYAKVFGWKFTEHPVGDMTYTMVKINDKDFAGIWAIPKDQEKQIPPHWLAYILVDNLEQSLEKATKNGATIIRPITQAGEYGRLAIIKDPTGAQVALWQNLKPKS